MASTAEKEMTRHSFVAKLKSYINTAWDYEQAFLANFWEWPGYDQVELLEFYMSGETCKVVVMSAEGKTMTSTISTEEFLDWAKDIIAFDPF